MSPKDLAKRINSRKAPCILDVRSGVEFRSGHIPGALHAPSLKILLGFAPLPRDKKELVVVTCEHGPRAQMANFLLGLRGYRNTTLLEGHMASWRRAGLQVEK
jgi:rhodanese-related sulfurtransferase